MIAAEPIERRLRHDGLVHEGLDDYAQWVENLLRDGHVSAEEADILHTARSATRKVIMVDDFTPEQMTVGAAAAKKTASRKKAVGKKAAVKA